jgi:hypothetical protein
MFSTEKVKKDLTGKGAQWESGDLKQKCMEIIYMLT